MLGAVLVTLLLPFAPAPAATADATVAHGDGLGSWVFEPGRTGARTAVPGQQPAGGGAGWSTDVLTGTIPAGTWGLAADVTTTVAPGTAQGQLVAAVYAVDADGARLLAMPATGDVLATSGSRAIALSFPLGEIELRSERLVVEWYLTIARHQRGDPTSTTTLRAGTGADAVTFPGALAPLPSVGPTRTAVTDPQDHRVTVTWTASSDDRVDRYAVRRASSADGPFVELGETVVGTSFVVTDLTNREPVFFDVVGIDDADGSRSPASNRTQGRALDRTPPEAPGRLTATPDGTGVIDLAWTASAAGDLATYEVERAATATGPFVVIARDLTTGVFEDRDLPPQTTWWYRIRAIDDDGLVSAPGEVGSTSTAPAVPTNVRIAAVDDRALTVAWDGTSRPLAGYRVERATGDGPFSRVGGLVTGTSFTDTGLQNGTTYRYRVIAEDRRGVRSTPSAPVSGAPRASAAPAPPISLALADATGGVTLEWGPSPSRDVVGYQILRSVGGAAATELGGLRTGRTYTDRDVSAGTRYDYTVVAVDDDGRRSAPTTAMTWVLQPSAPRDLTATPVGLSTVSLAWDASSDRTASYEVWRAEGAAAPALIARVDGTSMDDVGLLLETPYRYFVRAVSAGFRASPASNTVEVTLRDGPPSPPAVTAVDTTEGGSIEVRWAPPAERDVVSWRIERRVAGDSRWDVIADVPQPLRSHIDDGLTDGVRYEYRLIAIDRGGTESPPSAVASAVPSDTTPPPSLDAPSVRLTVGALAVDWDVAPTAVRYEVLRSTSPEGPYELIATTSLRSVRDTDVRPGGTYHYRIVAFDEAGNGSAPSGIGSGTFRTSVSPGAVVPVLPVAGGGAGPGGGTGAGPGAGTDGWPTPPPAPSPFEPTIAVFPAFGGQLGGDAGVGAGGRQGPAAPAAPSDEPSILAFPTDLGPLRDAVSAGDLPAAVGRVIGEVAGNVPDVARTFSIPLALVGVILLYLIAQGRIDRNAPLLTVDRPVGGDDDDAEFLL
ncbi:MAG: fibronectin type III domain-containing protein [Actinobacteria bacterium]|nr:fibronectin type III domain-containing protein [Actinomycetota bacterium]